MTLPIYPLRLRFSTPDGRLPRQLLGSAWRGALGHALKRTVCIFKHGACDGCPLLSSCTYPLFYETRLLAARAGAQRGMAVPYALAPLPASEGGGLDLYCTLIGERAVGAFPFVLHALREAAAGGVARTCFAFEAVERWAGDGWRPLDHWPQALDSIPPAPAGDVRIRFLTPIRFKFDGRLVAPERMSLELFATALRRRLISLAAAWGHEAAMRALCPPLEQPGAWRTAELRWREQPRYSTRQRQEMKLGGVIGGAVVPAEAVERLWPLLWLGSWVQVGKQTTMGLGRYAMG